MASLIVTFTYVDASREYDAPLSKGAAARTETITMPGESTPAAGNESVVELLADADCWVAIGANPDATIATDGTGRARLVKADIPYQFQVEPGDSIAVAAA